MNLIKKIRKKILNVKISTDIIVGFPGETKKQFENTVKLCKKAKFFKAYVSQYSPRPSTATAKMEDNVSKKEKVMRERAINEILKKTALINNKKLINTIQTALMDSAGKTKGEWIGKTEGYKAIKVKSNKNLLGRFVKVKTFNADYEGRYLWARHDSTFINKSPGIRREIPNSTIKKIRYSSPECLKTLGWVLPKTI